MALAQHGLKVIVSIATFNELSLKLEQQSYKFGENVGSFTVEKGTLIVPDKDFRLVNFRQNAADIASRSYKAEVHGEDFVSYVNKLFDFIYNGTEVHSPSTQPIVKGW